MRQKLGMVAFVLLLVAVWGVGFLWFRGDLDLASDDSDKLAAAGAGASAEPRPSTSPALTPSAIPSLGPAAVPSYTGRVTAGQERRSVDINPAAPRPKPRRLAHRHLGADGTRDRADPVLQRQDPTDALRAAAPRRAIDWIFGSPGAQFSSYGIDRSALVRRTTDHPVIHTKVTIDAMKFENAYTPEPAQLP